MKRVSQLHGLSDDHHTALVIAAGCRQVSSETLGEFWSAIKLAVPDHFARHFSIEEEVLLPALESLHELELAGRIRTEHAQILREGKQLACSLEAVRAFGKQLAANVRFEEREVFERVQHRLDSEVLTRIELTCRRVERTCPRELLGGSRGG